MVLMNPAADKLLLDLVERSLSGELHASGFASASAHLPQAVQLKGGSKPFSRPISPLSQPREAKPSHGSTPSTEPRI